MATAEEGIQGWIDPWSDSIQTFLSGPDLSWAELNSAEPRTQKS